MPAPRYGFEISGIEPLDIGLYGGRARRAFWRSVVVFAIEAKDAELAKGLDRFGQPMTPISPTTRKHRRSWTGFADPSAPPLTPAYGLSRTRFLLDGRALANSAEFFWRADPVTGKPWGRILGYHRDGRGRLPVRDVIGLSQAALARVKRRSLAEWDKIKAGASAPEKAFPGRVVLKSPVPQAPSRIKVTGRTDFENATPSIGGSRAQSEKALAAGTFTGFREKFRGPNGQIIRGLMPESPRRPSAAPPRGRTAPRPPVAASARTRLAAASEAVLSTLRTKAERIPPRSPVDRLEKQRIVVVRDEGVTGADVERIASAVLVSRERMRAAGIKPRGYSGIKIIDDPKADFAARVVNNQIHFNVTAMKLAENFYRSESAEIASGKFPSFAMRDMADVAVHEAGHVLHRLGSAEDFRTIAVAFSQAQKQSKNGQTRAFPSAYGQQDDSEAFAEAVVAIVNGKDFTNFQGPLRDAVDAILKRIGGRK